MSHDRLGIVYATQISIPNRQALNWCDLVANARVHGTSHQVPWEMLDKHSVSG